MRDHRSYYRITGRDLLAWYAHHQQGVTGTFGGHQLTSNHQIRTRVMEFLPHLTEDQLGELVALAEALFADRTS